MRFVRYLKKKRKELALAALKLEKKEQLRLRQEMKDHVRQLREQEKAKLLFEKEQERRHMEEVRQKVREHAVTTSEILKDESREEKERISREKSILKRKKRRLYRYAIRLSVRNFSRKLFAFRPKDVVKGIHKIRSESTRIRKFSFIAINSTTIFLLSYFAFYLLVQAATIVASMLFHYPTTLYYYEIYFNISVEDWYHDSVKTIFSAGPVLALIAGIAFILLFYNKKELTGLFKLFFLWGFLHGISMFFGAMLIGTLFESGIGHVIDWLYIMDTGKVLYSIMSIFMLVVAGFLSIKPFLLSGNTYYQNMTRSNRNRCRTQTGHRG